MKNRLLAIALLICTACTCSKQSPLKAYRYTPPPPPQETWTWTKLNCQAVAPTVISVNPSNSNILYVGASQELWKSTDGGSNFIKIWDMGVFDLAIDTRIPEVIYAALSMAGVWRSRDNGNTWEQLTNRYADFVRPDRFDSSYIFAGPWRSTDYGATWALSVPYLFGPDEVYGFDQSWQNPNILYAGWHLSSGGRVYKSIDRGASWTVAWGGMGAIYSLQVHPLTDQTVYADRSYGSGDSLLKTTDGGSNWTNFAIGPGGVVLAAGLAVDKRPGFGNILYAGGNIGNPETSRGIYRSTNGGVTWEQIGLQNVPVWNLTVDPTASVNTTVIYAVSYDRGAPTDGVYRGVLLKQ